MTRNEIQSKAVELSIIHNNLFLEWCTGLGKTFAALDIVSKLEGRGYIVLAETSHRTNWLEEIYKHGYQEILGRCVIVLYASIHKLADTNIDWVIYDEAHNMTSDKRMNAIKSIKSKHNILLTATLEKEQKELIKPIFKDLYTHNVSLQEAIEWEILPAPEINLIPIKLKSVGNTEEITITKGLSKDRIKLSCSYNERWSIMKKHKAIELTFPCTQIQKYIWLEEQMDYWRNLYFHKKLEWQKAKWLQFGSQRKRFLAEVKTPYALEIIHKLSRDKVRFICFAGSIKQAEILGSHNNVVHSKKKGNQDIINSFNKKEISSLFTVGMIIEGINLKDIEVGIIIQLDNGLRTLSQKLGRSLRAIKPIQYIFYIEDTRDEEYLNKVIEGLEKYIKK